MPFSHAQSIILGSVQGFSLLEVGGGTVDSLANVVASEEGSGLGGGSDGGRSSVSHDVVLSGSLAIQKLFFSSL